MNPTGVTVHSESEPGMLDSRLSGKVAVISGAGSRGPGIGIGRACAVRLAQSGAHVVLVDNIGANLEGTVRMCASLGVNASAVVADVADDSACRSLAADVLDQHGRVDILVNNVGVTGPAGSVVDIDLDAWRTCLRINIDSVLLLSRYLIPAMAGSGAIVNMASVAGLRGGHPSVAYSASKGALLSLTQAMAAMHGPDGIRVNAVAPGLVHTPLMDAQGLDEHARRLRAEAAPLRTEGTGWDVAEAVRYLAGPESRWTTGIVLPVDAGLTSTIDPVRAPTVTAIGS